MTHGWKTRVCEDCKKLIKRYRLWKPKSAKRGTYLCFNCHKKRIKVVGGPSSKILKELEDWNIQTNKQNI